jgi:uncharacterized membrane protein YfcA
MALLPGFIGLQKAVPLVALLALVLELVLLIRYWRYLQMKAVLRITLVSLLTVPIGIIGLRHLNEHLMLAILGFLILGYALYALFTPHLPALRHPAWEYAAGLTAGILGGAYSTSGPPVVIFGQCRGWQPMEFKGNLQGFFLVNTTVLVAGHAWGGNITPEIWRLFFTMLPVTAVGAIAGLSFDRLIKPLVFKKIVLVLLLILGLRLMVGA